MLGGRWDSQDESLFDVNDVRSIPSASQSLASVSHERSIDTVSMRRSRIPSQENGERERVERDKERAVEYIGCLYACTHEFIFFIILYYSIHCYCSIIIIIYMYISSTVIYMYIIIAAIIYNVHVLYS